MSKQHIARSGNAVEKANYRWQDFSDSEQLCQNLAERIRRKLQDAIDKKGKAVLALSGGSTPKPLLAKLVELEFDWSNVVVTLVDERWVPVGHEMSNAGMILELFLEKLKTYPRFVPLFAISAAAMDADSSRLSVLSDFCIQTESTHSSPADLDVVILGMGGDGHTASFFPDAENIGVLIDPKTQEYLLSCHTPSSKLPRITWSVPALLKADFLALHITGQEKKQVFADAANGGEVSQLPIRSMLFQDKAPLEVFYCD